MSATPRSRSATAALVTVALAVAACTGDDDTATTSTPTTVAPTAAPTTQPATSTTTPPSTTSPTTSPTTSSSTTTVPGADVSAHRPAGLRQVEPFADYRWVALLDDAEPYAGPPTPTSLDDVLLVPAQDWLFGPESAQPELAAPLEANGFVVNGGWGNRFFHDTYKSAVYEYQPLFVTSDAMYHTWHVVFDKILRDTEQERLLPALEDLLTGAVDAAREQESALAGTDLADAAHRVTAYYEAAATVLELDVGTINDLAAEEVAMIDAGAGMQTSPVSGLIECEAPNSFVGCVDFSLFRPRGHYTRTPDLERYFVAMSVLGQEGFALADGIGVVPGLLMARVLTSDADLLAGWTAVYEPTAFLVGLADDIGPLEMVAAADRAIPGWSDDVSLLMNADTEALADAVLAARPVAIDPERASVRLMGARFTLDSFVLDQLAWPNVGREPPPERRVLVSGRDVAAAFGSSLAREMQLATESHYYRYEEQLDAMTELVASRGPADWAGTVYDAWLAALEPQFHDRGDAYPDFMRTDAWAAKSLQTGLASYTELKHDTVLYTKQGSAGEGEGPEPPDFEPRHWVEPDPVAFGRIAAAADLMRAGFAERDLLTPATDDLLATTIELADWLTGIAAGELAGDVVTDAENQRLAGIGSELEYLWLASSDILPEADRPPFPDWNERAGLVTDIFTTSFDYLQLGTGGIETIYVIVPIGDGRFELAVGAVPSYYEFWRSSGEPRLTDDEWRVRVSDGDVPLRPHWTDAFLVGSEIATDPIVRE